jgi:hypothetical protein
MDPKLVDADTFRHYGDAATAKALLDANGIPSVLANDNANDLFGGALCEVRLQVAVADVERAKVLLRSIERTRLAAPPADDGIERCLACGATLATDAKSCAKCGFTFEGEETHLYANGPLPDSLLAHAVAPVDSQRFALPPADVARYLDWCMRGGLAIRGYEVWSKTLVGHRVEQRCDRVGADELRRAALAAVARDAAETTSGPELFFSPTTESVKEAAAD